MTTDPDAPDAADLASGSNRRAPSWTPPSSAPRAEQIGRVEEVGDGIALVSGLPDARLDELLRFDKGQFGFAQVLERDRVGCVLLDDADAIEAGDTVRGTGDVVRVPVGPGAARPRRRSARPPARRQGADRRRHAASRSSGRRRRSSTAIWSPSRCRPALSSSTRCSRSAAASAN